MLNRTLLCLTIVSVAACAQVERSETQDAVTVATGTEVRQVAPVVETTPVETKGDAADDPAIWVDTQDPSRSVVIGTDKQRGLQVYDLDGRLLQTLPDGRMNNVDLRDGFRVDGRAMVLVAASNRSDRSIALYLLDPATRRLTRAADPVSTGFVEPYGLCMYASPDGGQFVFVSEAASGRFRQWRIQAKGDEIVTQLVREFVVGSQAEGCAADDETGALYVAEEDGGFWRYRADADGSDDRREIDRVGGQTGLVGDIEGVSIWHGRDGRGYLVLSNQGVNLYAVYRREGNNAFVGQFRVVDNDDAGIDGTSETDGLVVSSQPLGPRYPGGLLVVQDGSNMPRGQKQNFKYLSWRDIARVLGIADGG